jgi:hypothetical protein
VPVSWSTTLALTDEAYREAAELAGQEAAVPVRVTG